MQLRLANWGKLKAIFEPAKSTESPVKRPLIMFLENTLELVQPMIHLEGFDDTSWRIELTSLQPCCVVCGDWEFWTSNISRFDLEREERRDLRKVLVIGLDGCNPDLVYKWIEESPNIKRLMEEGIHGRIESSIPPITPQAWTVVFSGKNPGHFGFWAFLYRDDYTYGELKLINSTVIQVDTVYDIVPDMGGVWPS